MVWKIKVMIDIYTNYNYNVIMVIIFFKDERMLSDPSGLPDKSLQAFFLLFLSSLPD